MTRPRDLLKWTLVVLNLAVWLPWLGVAILSVLDVSLRSSATIVALSLLGIAIAVICARGRPRWELRAVVPVLALLVWVAFLYVDVSARPLHTQSGCVLCSVVDWRLRTSSYLIGRGSYLLAFDVLWYDFVAPASVLLSAVLLLSRNASRVVASIQGRAANAT